MELKSAILLSGGIDSAAVAYWKRPALAVTVDYGQAPAEGEKHSADHIARCLGIEHRLIVVNLRSLGSGVLSGQQQLDIAPTPEWWPFRNQLLITLAGMVAVETGCSELLIGIVATDGLHADATPSFLQGIDALISQQEGYLRVCGPAAAMETEKLVRLSGLPRDVLVRCHSCHVANLACGQCRGCQKNRAVRNAFGMTT